MIIESYKNGSVAKVQGLERHYNIVLPSDYRDFLIHENGANITEGYFFIKEIEEYVLMGNLFGIDTEGGFSDLVIINDEYREDVSEESILIGTHAGNSFILLVPKGEHSGIWFYDECCFFSQSTDDSNTYFICETFTEFIEMLKIKYVVENQ